MHISLVLEIRCMQCNSHAGDSVWGGGGGGGGGWGHYSRLGPVLHLPVQAWRSFCYLVDYIAITAIAARPILIADGCMRLLCCQMSQLQGGGASWGGRGGGGGGGGGVVGVSSHLLVASWHGRLGSHLVCRALYPAGAA